MRKYFAKNPLELRNINELEKNYSSDTIKNPVRKYAKSTFLHRLVNLALRQHSIDAIFLFGFFSSKSVSTVEM
jgi:hypothetical protein